MNSENFWLGRYAKFVVLATLALIFLGGMVTSLGAGLSVPDWPTSFGYNMFLLPLSRWLGPRFWELPAFWEHSHRLVASTIGLLTIILTVWIWRVEQRAWVRRVAGGALLLVIAQGVMGGLRVTHLSITLAMIHGCTAQAFLCVLTLLALALSPTWQQPAAGEIVARARSWRRWAWVLAGAIFLQLILGAVMRHLGAGLAIPTFPLTPEGSLMPKVHNAMVDINFTHRFWALVVTALTVIVVIKVVSAARTDGCIEARLLRPAIWLAGLVAMQIILGASVIWMQRSPLPTSFHVLNGAAVLMMGFILAVRGSRLSIQAPSQS